MGWFVPEVKEQAVWPKKFKFSWKMVWRGYQTLMQTLGVGVSVVLFVQKVITDFAIFQNSEILFQRSLDRRAVSWRLSVFKLNFLVHILSSHWHL